MKSYHIILIDSSGSIVNSPVEEHFLRILSERVKSFDKEDFMDVVLFSTTHKALFGKVVPCVEVLKQFVINETENRFFFNPSGTDLKSALKYVFSNYIPPSGYSLDIQILTDGQIDVL